MVDPRDCGNWRGIGCGWRVNGGCDAVHDDDRIVPFCRLFECPKGRVPTRVSAGLTSVWRGDTAVTAAPAH